MYKSCSYCGRIHPMNYICPKKPIKIKKITNKDKFRSTGLWQDKRKEIVERDNGLCLVCFEDNRYTYKDISVHHIVPLEEDFELRLEDSNLISLCRDDHEDAESGKISRQVLHDIVIKRMKQ